MHNQMNKHNRAIATLLSFVLIFGNFALIRADYSAAPANSGNTENPHITASNESRQQGEYVDIVVSLVENPGIFMLSFQLGYDAAALELIGFDTAAPAILPLPQPPPPALNPLPFNFIDFFMNDTDAIGDLLIIRFRVRDNAPLGNSEITLANRQAVGYPGIVHEVAHTLGGVYISPANGEPAEPGDVHLVVLGDNGLPGDYVDVVVELMENPGLFMLSFHLGFDASRLELISFDTIAPEILPLPQRPLLTANPLPFNFIDFSMTDSDTIGGLITLRFRIRDNAPLGNALITLANLQAVGYPDIEYEVTHENCAVYVGIITNELSISILPSPARMTDGEIALKITVANLPVYAVPRYLGFTLDPNSADPISFAVELALPPHLYGQISICHERSYMRIEPDGSGAGLLFLVAIDASQTAPADFVGLGRLQIISHDILIRVMHPRNLKAGGIAPLRH